MSCTSPIPAIDLGIDKTTGKHRIKIKLPHVGESFEEFKHKYVTPGSKVILLPCGHCLACQVTKRREWAIRSAMEAKYHKENCFVTLTYDDKYLPKTLKIGKRDFQQFIKNLRNDGLDVRYFGCGEFGGETNRFHIHICIFGWCPSDMHKRFESNSMKACFTSEQLDKYWKFGMAIVQPFDTKAGGYVAGYTAKKYGDTNGFILMSKRPGIGYQYLQDYKLDIAEFYRVVDSLGPIKDCKPPRYFDKLCEKTGIDLTSIKEDLSEFYRIGRAVMYQQLKADHINQIFANQEYFTREKLSKLRRSL